MKQLDQAIKAISDNRQIRPILGDNISIHVSRLILSSLFDMGTMGECFLFHSGKHLGEALVENGIVKGDNMKSVLESLIEVLEKLKLGIYSLRSVTKNTAVIDSKECYFCSGMHSNQEGICHYDRGLVTGALSKALNRNFMILEVKCQSLGSTVCEFKIKGV
jgi:predicted hydrocarbon binding protein